MHIIAKLKAKIILILKTKIIDNKERKNNGKYISDETQNKIVYYLKKN